MCVDGWIRHFDVLLSSKKQEVNCNPNETVKTVTVSSYYILRSGAAQCTVADVVAVSRELPLKDQAISQSYLDLHLLLKVEIIKEKY